MIANLSYIQKQMQGLPNTNFILDWKSLSEDDKDTLKAWAQKEQETIEAEAK